jgi:hypothetical protein
VTGMGRRRIQMSREKKRARFLGIKRFIIFALLFALNPATAFAGTITNTATVTYQAGGVTGSISTNTVPLNTLLPPTPATIAFLQYAPGANSSTSTPADGGLCQTGPGQVTSLPTPTDFSGHALNATAYPLLKTGVFHAGEPIFITVVDGNRNLDPAVRDRVEIRVTTSTGDEEILQLQETGPNTGLFAAAIQSTAIPPQPASFDCRLSVNTGTTLSADYTDSFLPADHARV